MTPIDISGDFQLKSSNLNKTFKDILDYYKGKANTDHMRDCIYRDIDSHLIDNMLGDVNFRILSVGPDELSVEGLTRKDQYALAYLILKEGGFQHETV